VKQLAAAGIVAALDTFHQDFWSAVPLTTGGRA
jgi:hypothetical protein